MSARRCRSSPARPHRLPSPAQTNHRARSPSADHLVFPRTQAFGKDRPEASASLDGMAGTFAEIVALPRGVPLGCQRPGLHFSSPRVQKSQRHHDRISKEFRAPGSGSSKDRPESRRQPTGFGSARYCRRSRQVRERRARPGRRAFPRACIAAFTFAVCETPGCR